MRIDGIEAVVGRASELARLGAAARHARRRPWLVVGEAGVGKSALLRAAAAEHGAGDWVWGHTSASQLGSLRPIVEVIGAAERSLPDASRRDGVARVLGAHTSLGEAAAAQLLADLLASYAEEGLTHVVVEDLHWADPETLAVLDVLVDQAPDTGCQLVMTSRDDELGRHRPVIDAWRARRAVEELLVEPLDEVGVAELLAVCLRGDVAPEAVQVISGLSHGLPLLVTEFADAFVAAGHLARHDGRWTHEQRGQVGVPRSMRAHARRRLESMPLSSRAVLKAAALAGEVDVDLLVAMGFEPAEVMPALEQGLATRLLDTHPEIPGVVRFRHELSRRAVVESMAPPRRAATASQLSDILEANGPTRSHLDARVELATQADATERRVGLLLEAAEDAVDRGHARRALALLARVGPLDELRQPERTSHRILTCRAHGQVGDLAAVEVVATIVEPELELAGDRARAALVALARARAEGMAGHWKPASARLAPFAEDPTGEAGVDARVLAFAAVAAIESHDRTAAATLAQAARTLAQRSGDGVAECEAIEVLGRITRDTDHEAAIAIFSSGVVVAEEHDLPLWRARALHERGLSQATLSTDRSGLDEALAAAEAVGAMGLAATAALELSTLAGYQFEADEALVQAGRCRELAERYGLGSLEARALVMTGQAHAVAGRRGEARAAGAAALARAPDDPEVRGLVHGLCEGMASLLAEDVGAAFEQLGAGIEALEELPFRTPSLPWYPWLVVSATIDPEGVGARARAAASGDGMLEALVIPLRLAEAIAAGRRGEPDVAAQAAREAEAEMDRFDLRRRSPGHMHLYLRHTAEAALADEWGDPVRWLTEAAPALDALGQRRVADRCRNLLRRAGVGGRRGRSRVPVPEPLASAEVTAREVEVLALLGERLTNAQIADRLVIAPGTVKSHVERLLAKTGRGNRHELGELARDLGL